MKRRPPDHLISYDETMAVQREMIAREDKIEALLRQNRELVTEIRIRDGIISDLQERLAPPGEAMTVNPEDYPHSLFWEGDHVHLVTRLEDGRDERRTLGTSTAVKDAYRRWDHLRKDHSRNEANVFLWGVMTGMGVALWNEIDAIVKRPQEKS